MAPASVLTLVDGTPAETIAANDRGLLYGDGLFETVAVCDGIPLCWERHMDRLRRGCTRLGIDLPDPGLLRAEAEQVWEAGGSGVLKIIVTRGRSGRGYRPQAGRSPTRIVARHPWPDYPGRFFRDGITLHLCRTPLGSSPALAGLKHLNRLEQVLARAEWDDPEVPEGLMLDPAGRIVAGTMSNLFLVLNGLLVTPDLSRAGVAGIMRDLVMEAARYLGHDVVVSSLGIADLEPAGEVFVCNSLIGVWPVVRLGERAWPVGALTRTLQASLASRGLIATGPGPGRS